ncbi:hypothetical protein CNR27_07230 [Luteimonas chenhongjianii]|uniref:Uncharacterized protein n=1 Tax=Luteimonas chenhongjianii TaxID=2006110 RepID=A0A290XE91_9GAMM|nr:hypothetical protein CNR27_07230 [Luteimonas chenhongjianii]
MPPPGDPPAGALRDSSGLDRQVSGGPLIPVELQPGVVPSVLRLAEDETGGLWVGACGRQLFRVCDD